MVSMYMVQVDWLAMMKPAQCLFAHPHNYYFCHPVGVEYHVKKRGFPIKTSA
jgi:hypothetical protein